MENVSIDMHLNYKMVLAPKILSGGANEMLDHAENQREYRSTDRKLIRAFIIIMPDILFQRCPIVNPKLFESGMRYHNKG
jgi:hypothetical protein